MIRHSSTTADSSAKSFDALEKLYGSDLDLSVKAVAVYLWFRADRSSGEAWPSQARMATDLSRSDRQIRNLLKQLELAGAITIIHGVGKTVNRYRIHFDRLADRKPMSGQGESSTGNGLPVTPETDCRGDRKPVADHPGNGLPAEQEKNSATKKSVNRGGTDLNSRLWSELSADDLTRAVKHDDLALLERLWLEAQKLPHPVPATDQNRVQLYAAAHYVVTAPRSEVRKPVAVFVAKVRDRDWRTGSQQSEDWARQAIRKVDRAEDIDASAAVLQSKTSTPTINGICGICGASPADRSGCDACRPRDRSTIPSRGLTAAELARIKPKATDGS